eukprot:TRINITY_DN8928_c0_g1_i2.p1 TRINITY_DN8928_c0_g1~~TRINITY_DN8928_c0_g1_i2.p1  ORF type:complete len:378 (-),score=57.30 TRINITY_DN8928_c0_g1_i2:980-2113(-)
MCGLCGIIFGKAERTSGDYAKLRSTFTRLLALNEARGKDAVGMAVILDDFDYYLLKRPGRAIGMIGLPEYHDRLHVVDDHAALLMGHTRQATVGCTERMDNAQPLRAGSCMGTVNGTITNADELFNRHRLPRFAEVDSELIVRLADSHIVNNDIALRRFIPALKTIHGQFSAVIVSLGNPNRILLLKGNRPLTAYYHDGLNVVAYSSEARHLDRALTDLDGWRDLNLKPMTYAVYDVENLQKFKTGAFTFNAHPGRRQSCVKYQLFSTARLLREIGIPIFAGAVFRWNRRWSAEKFTSFRRDFQPCRFLRKASLPWEPDRQRRTLKLRPNTTPNPWNSKSATAGTKFMANWQLSAIPTVISAPSTSWKIIHLFICGY